MSIKSNAVAHMFAGFQPGDRVRITAQGLVTNVGDQGTVVAVYTGELHVDFDSPRCGALRISVKRLELVSEP